MNDKISLARSIAHLKSDIKFPRPGGDFSHGCIRVEKPDELAAWVPQGKPEWTLEKVRTAMQAGKDNVQVNLA
jgi:murein L,D-transpeptidase YcbB/YkuD